MSFIIDNQRNFSLQVSPIDLPKLDAMRWDSQQLSLVVERTAIRPSDGATFLHGKVVVLTKDQQIESLNQEIDRLSFVLGKQQKEIEDLKNVKVDSPKKAKTKMGDD